ncbi:Cytoplasmic polyadenylation element-binding protein 2 [Varanus komodoensis]|nr:Cytoplasmic polyadenylation element-binding protein 2 [Varanus komodoensis]
MRKVDLDESPVGIKIAGRNINSLRYADDTTLMAESEEELKSLLMWVKEESTKVGLKLNIKKTKLMASGPITSWQIDGEEMEVVTDFIFLGSKITANGDCSQEIKRLLLLGRKAMTNLDSILKSRDITVPIKDRNRMYDSLNMHSLENSLIDIMRAEQDPLKASIEENKEPSSKEACGSHQNENSNSVHLLSIKMRHHLQCELLLVHARSCAEEKEHDGCDQKLISVGATVPDGMP